jgi:hypothetical protein
LVEISGADLEPGVGEIRLDGQALLKSGDGFVVLLELEIRQSEVVIVRLVLRFEVDDFLGRRDGSLVIPGDVVNPE